MDLNNVRIDWAPILEGQIKHLESQYPDIPVRKSYSAVIEALNSNKLKSRVILSGINVSGYAFIAPSNDLTDRIYGSMGFTNPSFANDDRIGNLLSWLEENAKMQKKHLMLNEIYNAEEISDKVLTSKGYHKFVRDRLDIDLSDVKPQSAPSDIKYQIVPLSKIRAEEYSDAEFEAFSGTADEILFNSSNRKERIEFARGIFTGKFGQIIEPASRFLAENGKIVAGTVCTHYRSVNGARTALLVDIFVSKKHQRRGLAKSLLMFSLESLKKIGYEECDLWVSEENPARLLYEKTGFKKSGTQEIFFYKKYPQ